MPRRKWYSLYLALPDLILRSSRFPAYSCHLVARSASRTHLGPTFTESRMREIRTSGLTRGRGHPPYSTVRKCLCLSM